MVYVAVIFTVIPFRSILLMIYPEISKTSEESDLYNVQ